MGNFPQQQQTFFQSQRLGTLGQSDSKAKHATEDGGHCGDDEIRCILMLIYGLAARHRGREACALLCLVGWFLALNGLSRTWWNYYVH